MSELRNIPSVYADIASGSDFGNAIVDIAKESNVGDVPKGYQLVVLGTSVFSGSQFNYGSGTNSAIVYNSRFNSGSVFYSFNTTPTGSHSLELSVNETLQISSIQQLMALKLYNQNGGSYNVSLTTEFFS